MNDKENQRYHPKNSRNGQEQPFNNIVIHISQLYTQHGKLPQPQFYKKSRPKVEAMDGRAKLSFADNQNYNPLYPPFLRGNLGREFPSNKRGVPPGRGVLKNFAELSSALL